MEVVVAYFEVLQWKEMADPSVWRTADIGAKRHVCCVGLKCSAATTGLLCQPRVIMKMIVESMIECRLAGETEVLGENLPQRHFCPTQNPTCPPGFDPGPPRWEAGD
jgi:hypothetical protein